jgi:hypothetical protein
MRIVRFLSAGQVRLGQQLDDDNQIALAIEGDLFAQWRVTDERLRIE